MGKKKSLVLLILAFVLCIGIISKIFFENTVFLWDINDGKTTYVHVGNTVIIALSSLSAIYLTNNNILRPVSGLTEVYPAAPPTPYVYGLTDKGQPTFRVVSAGSVDILAPVRNPPGLMIPSPLKAYHFKVIAIN